MNALIVLNKIALSVMKNQIEYCLVLPELLENVNASKDIMKILMNAIYVWKQFRIAKNAIIKMNAYNA